MIFLIDCDEVLADFTKTVLGIAEKTFGDAMPKIPGDCWDIFDAFDPEQKQYLEEVIGRRYFCLRLPVCDGALEGAHALRAAGFELVCVTTPWKSQTWAYERQIWLEEHFQIDRDHTIFTEAKHLVRGAAFLDDRAKHVEKWRSCNSGLGLVWGTPFNVGAQHRVQGWDPVLEAVGRCF